MKNVAKFVAATALLGATAAASAAEPVRAGAGFDGPYGNSPFMRDAREFDLQSPLDWPAAEVREAVFARARTVLAKYEVMRARERIGQQVERMKRQFNASPEYAAALEAEDQAWAAYQSAVASVTTRLMNDPAYTAYVALADDLREEIRDLAYEAESAGEVRLTSGPRSPARVSPDVLDRANAKLGYATRASRVRADALASDPAVAEARAQLSAASSKVRTLRKQFNLATLDDDSVLKLREALWTARADAVAAEAYEHVARQIAIRAWRYAYFLHRNDAWSARGGNFANSWWYYPPTWSGFADGAEARPANGYGFRRR